MTAVIDARGLCKTLPGDGATRSRRCAGSACGRRVRWFGVPGTQRRASHHAADADHAAADRRGQRHGRWAGCPAPARAGARRIGYVSQLGRGRRAGHRPGEPDPAGQAVRPEPRGRGPPGRGSAGAVRPGRVCGSAGADLLRRPSGGASTWPRRGARARGAVPRRAEQRAGPAEPGRSLGSRARAARPGHHGVPDHALPGRSRRALRRGWIIDYGPIVAEGPAGAQAAGRGRRGSCSSARHARRGPRRCRAAGQPYVRDLNADGDPVRLYASDGGSALPGLLRLLDRNSSGPVGPAVGARPSTTCSCARPGGRCGSGDEPGIPALDRAAAEVVA